MLAYSTSKSAVIGLTKVQGKDYAETGITVNALAPAVINTPMVAIHAARAGKVHDRQNSHEALPVRSKRLAAMASFIVSPEASFTTGFTFDLTGGRAVY